MAEHFENNEIGVHLAQVFLFWGMAQYWANFYVDETDKKPTQIWATPN
jgi:hypothetical protein